MATSFKVNRYGKSSKPPGTMSLAAPVQNKFTTKKKKKKVVEDEEVVKKKKKKKKTDAKPSREKETKPKAKSTELAVLDSKTVNRQLKTMKKFEELGETVQKVQSTFGLREQAMEDAMEGGDTEYAILMFQKQAYATILKLIPLAEEEYKKGKRDHQAYVLNALISQGRELAADLQASGDRQQLAELIISEILEPTFKGILQFMMQEQMQLKALLSDKIKPQFLANATAEIDQNLKNVAANMTALYKITAENIRKKLLGD